MNKNPLDNLKIAQFLTIQMLLCAMFTLASEIRAMHQVLHLPNSPLCFINVSVAIVRAISQSSELDFSCPIFYSFASFVSLAENWHKIWKHENSHFALNHGNSYFPFIYFLRFMSFKTHGCFWNASESPVWKISKGEKSLTVISFKFLVFVMSAFNCKSKKVNSCLSFWRIFKCMCENSNIH